MKRGKDDEMGPMFPRLHVNDKEKGGPRAPPRNKMALYEQLSIPSQRFNPGVLPLNPSNTSNLGPRGSSSQGSGLERNSIFLHHGPTSTPTHLAEKFHAWQPDGANTNTPLAQFEQMKKVGDEDDFTVPVFFQSGMGQCQIKSLNGIDREKLTPFSPTYSGHPITLQNVCEKDPKQISSRGLSLRQEERSQSEENPKMCVSNRGHSVKSTINISVNEKIDGHVKEASTYPNQEHSDHPAANLSRFCDNDGCLRQEFRAESQPDSTGCGDGVESTRDLEEGTVPWSRSGSRSGGYHGNQHGNQPVNDSEHLGDKTCESFQLGNEDKGDESSETSMVDSVSGLQISPDDVVGMIGQKHFWKARRAIVNQQRVFAVQVFELHRLIKVQQLIAESPHLLLEHNAYLGKPPLKSCPAKKLSSEYVVKPLPYIAKGKGDSEKPNHKMECSAENAVGKTSLSPMKNGNQLYGPYLGNPPPTPMGTDAKMAPWCSHQSPGHQWLIPVMSPSEGLVYKPYPGPGFLGTTVCGPFGQTPLTGSFMNPAYGLPGHPHYEGLGVLPGGPPIGHSYFPPYGMPVMNPAIPGSAVEQMSQFPGPGSHGRTGQLSGGGTNFNMQHQSSCNVPTQKSGAIAQVKKFQVSKDTEILGSTASSPGERVQGDGMDHAAGGRDALSLFPLAPIIVEGAPQPHDTDQTTRVIKVVPHNPISATESAARIFQCIQDERKQFD